MVLRTIIFLLINFAGLFIGGLFTGEGVPSDWYQNLNKAPWTTIMICFSLFLSVLWKKIASFHFTSLYSILFILNVSWNPIFFYFRWVFIALIVIAFLTYMIGYTANKYKGEMRYYNLLLLPYFIWLIIATSLNAYIVIYN